MISVIMSSYNGCNTIDRAIKSILNQTYSNFEFIICNDGSTDNTLHHIKTFAIKDDRIRIINHKVNRGLQKSLNDCLKLSKGNLIARMDDDDYSIKNRFMEQIIFLKNHVNIDFVGSNAWLRYNNIIYGQRICPKFPTKNLLFKHNCFIHPSIMIKANVIKLNKYSLSPKFFRAEDYELWLRLYSKGYEGANIQENLIEYSFNIQNKKHKFKDYFDTFRLLVQYRYMCCFSIKKYFWILSPLIKMFIPSCLRNIIYKFKYKNM